MFTSLNKKIEVWPSPTQGTQQALYANPISSTIFFAETRPTQRGTYTYGFFNKFYCNIQWGIKGLGVSIIEIENIEVMGQPDPEGIQMAIVWNPIS